MCEPVNYYYSDELSNDPEGNLVQLCQTCAAKHQDVAQWAGKGDAESECELCDACNDPEERAWMQEAEQQG